MPGPSRFNTLKANRLVLKGVDVVTAMLLATNEVADLNGEKLIIDVDADTYIRMTGGPSGTDDSVDFFVAGAADFRMLGNIFRALAGSVVQTDTIDETTSAAGVTIDGLLIKDSQASTDQINEKTSAAGVTIDGALLKDGRSNLGRQVQALTASAAISIKSGLVTLAHATVAIAATLAAPVAGDELIIANTSASGTAAHTVTLPAGVTWDGTNNTATLDAPNEALHVIAVSATRWYIVDNNGSVGLSTV